MKILVADPLSEEGLQVLRAENEMHVDVLTGLKPEELTKCIKDYDALVIRSQTKVTADVLQNATRLKVIGRAGVGIDNIDVPAATKHGVVVMNTPAGNTIAACELTMAMILTLSRNILPACLALRDKRWDRKSYIGSELFGKTLGIIGLGRIGTEVARRAQSFGMDVICYDPFVSEDKGRKLEVRLLPLEELLESADYITLHGPLTDDTRHMISTKQFAMMKDGVRLVNCARGGVIDEDALYEAIVSGKVAGCGLDVFEQEPAVDNKLIGLEQVIATPHLGASTEEAQEKVATQILEQIVEFLKGGVARNAINIPNVSADLMKMVGPYISLAEKLGMLLAQLAGQHMNRVKITYFGDMISHDVRPITRALIKGLLTPALQESVNYVNAPAIAEERGLTVSEETSSSLEDFANLIRVEGTSPKKTTTVSGTYFGKDDPRVVRINEFHVDAVPEGYMLVCENEDKPGVISHLSTLLAQHNINIAGMTVGRKAQGGKAVTVINIDNTISSDIMEEIKKPDIILDAQLVKF